MRANTTSRNSRCRMSS